MSDIVEKLRIIHRDNEPSECDEAADEIERLRAERNILVKHLDELESDATRCPNCDNLRLELGELRRTVRRLQENMTEGAEMTMYVPYQEETACTEEDRIEAAYWRFDARRKGYGQWKQAPMSERDAFKAEMRNALAEETTTAESEIARLRKIETGAKLTLGLLWMIDHREKKVLEAYRILRDALGGPRSEALGGAIKVAIDADYEADHPPSADWWAGKKE